MTRRPVNPPNRLTPVSLRPGSGPSWRASNVRLNQTPTHQNQRNIRPILMDDSDYSYSDLSSGNEKIQVIKVANNKANQPILLSDYSSEDYSDHAIKTNLVRNQQNDYSYSDYYSSSVPSDKGKKASNKNLKSTPSREINFTPQNNQKQNEDRAEKAKFVRPNIRNANSTPNVQSLENNNDQINSTAPNTSSTPNNQNPHRQRIKRRVVRSNDQQHEQGPNNDDNDNDPLKLKNNNNNDSNISNSQNQNNNNDNNIINNKLPNDNNITANANIANSASAPANISIDLLKSIDPNAPFRHFILTREVGKFHKLKTHLFTDKSKVFLHSKDRKTIDRKSIHYFVGESELSELPAGSKKDFKSFSFNDSIVHLKWNKRLTRFTLCTPQTKNYRDDRLGELLGVYINTNSHYENVQHGDSSTKSYLIFTAVIPKNQSAYYPVSERLTLTELAKNEDEGQAPKKSPFKKNKKDKKGSGESENEISTINLDNTSSENNLTSANMNAQNQSKIDPRFMRLVQADLETIPESELGNIFFQKSHKNFAFVDEETGKPIFLFFRSSKNSFSIKVKPPMLPLQAHALAVVILKRNMQWQFV